MAVRGAAAAPVLDTVLRDRLRLQRRSPGSAAVSPEEADRRRPTATGILFTLGVLALAVFGVWAWSVRSHADDLAAWDTLETTFEVMDRSLTPLGHSEAPPCEDEQDGSLTRTYPPSTGPQAAAVIGYLTQLGWSAAERVRRAPTSTRRCSPGSPRTAVAAT